MITTAITAMKDRGGSSRQAIEKYIRGNNRVTGDISVHLKMALKRGVKSGRLLHTKGTGASGSFKVGKAPAVPKRRPAKKKAVAKRPRKKAATPRKKRATKKTGAKKAAKRKSTGKKSPAKKKVAKKPRAKSAATKRTKSPKKRAAPKKKAARKTKTAVARK